MGYLRAIEAATTMTEFAGLDAALDYHLTANHYPPVPRSMIPVCVTAIELATDEQWSDEVFLPEGITYKDRPTAPVLQIIQQHHLEAFVDNAQAIRAEEESYE